MAEHTPGPWAIFSDDEGGIEIRMGTALQNLGHFEVQHAILWDLSLDPDEDADQYDEAMANAHLIAASPDLLSDVERTAAHYRVILPYLREIAGDAPRFSHIVSNTERELASLEADIAKATGEQQLADAEEWGPDSATQLLERGPR